MADQLSPSHPLFGLGYAKPARTREFLRLDGDTAEEGSADVAEEVPVAIAYNNRPHVVMMATPADYDDFAIGFTLTEEIVPSVDQIQSVTVVPYNQGVEIQLAIPQPLADALAERGRQLVGRTGCGLCGVQTITDALRPPRTVAPPKQPIAPDALWNAEAALWDHQTLNQATAAVHAAAWATADGKLVVVREDVGRHNALDKVVGALARQKIEPANGFIIMTSRASYELIQKASVAGVPLLAAVSRPSGLAIRLAESAGIALVGLLRGKSANVYTHREHISHA
ncbi:MAG TPA: formate dehydrogenase accessory sulfurtransferase FdhD [Gemmatimonadaceae bacterium]|nr:formate dehydrogenase accessory sulfurtransferase FdhD [Gemmatimonadaceae bacterium]